MYAIACVYSCFQNGWKFNLGCFPRFTSSSSSSSSSRLHSNGSFLLFFLPSFPKKNGGKKNNWVEKNGIPSKTIRSTVYREVESPCCCEFISFLARLWFKAAKVQSVQRQPAWAASAYLQLPFWSLGYCTLFCSSYTSAFSSKRSPWTLRSARLLPCQCDAS